MVKKKQKPGPAKRKLRRHGKVTPKLAIETNAANQPAAIEQAPAEVPLGETHTN